MSDAKVTIHEAVELWLVSCSPLAARCAPRKTESVSESCMPLSKESSEFRAHL